MKLSRGALIVVLIVLVILLIGIIQIIAQGREPGSTDVNRGPQRSGVGITSPALASPPAPTAKPPCAS